MFPVRFLIPLILAAAMDCRIQAADAGEVPAPPVEPARQILKQTKVRGGLAVLLGWGDGTLAAALAADERFVIHVLEPSEAKVAPARQHLHAQGRYGRVSVEHWPRPHLPYADNLVNLLVSENSGDIPIDEALRVLAPEGAACLRGKGGWQITVKPRPQDIGEWTHFLHDAGNNAVARDSRVGPPRSLQWLAPPLWLRSHETPSGFQGMVAGGGRMFYFLDEGLVGITDQRLPERWSLVCRDAFNGKLLWKRPLEPWGWPQWAANRFAGQDWTTIRGGRTSVPDENQRRLVADGPRLYVTLGYRAPLSILDAATGRTLHTVAGTAPARQILASEGVVVVYSDEGNPALEERRGKAKREEPPASPPGKILGVDGAGGRVLWQQSVAALRGLFFAIDQGRVFGLTGKELRAFELKTGKELWRAAPREARGRTLVATDGVLVLLGQKELEARDGATGQPLWHRPVTLPHGLGGEDLFVVDGVVWPGLLPVDEDLKPADKSPHALAVGYDLRTGEERERILARDLRSPEHHHRCYRNKATAAYMITAMEGSEFFDLSGENHSQNNFVRGACRLGIMPCNGLLYAPPDQCFCDPGAKLLGFAAIGPATAPPPTPDDQRLQRGPAYGQISNFKSEISNSHDWPTFRRDPARHGSTPSPVATPLAPRWRVKPGGKLTAAVCVADQVFVAERDAHTLHALDLATGQPRWTFTAGGRIDSPPTVHLGRVLFGSADGWVYCLRASDGAPAWRFQAAPSERRILCFDQVESVWPVHGSVLVSDGIAYVTAGRSTYLDGGIRLYGLDPGTGQVRYQTALSGPFPDGKSMREVSFYIDGANSDVLVSEGGAIFMRQKRLTPSLQEQPAEALSTKGEADVGRHVFSTSGLLDDSWYNRAFWMYAKRWPGFQLANQAPKSGQLLVVDAERTYFVHPFYRRNVHSPMFFPAKEGYLLAADHNENEPQIVGEEGARPPVAWLPQSDYQASKGLQTLDSPAFGLDKMMGYTRAEPPLWQAWQPVRIRAMVKAGDTLFVAGPPDQLPAEDPYAAFEGRCGARLLAVNAANGETQSEIALDVPPVFDGMIAARGCLFLSLEDGSLLCLAGQKR